MDWEDLRHFSAFATAGSLSAAARLLSVEHATVARRIEALESRLAVVLVDRRNRRWTLTADGERIAAIAAKMEANAQSVRRVAKGARAEIAGIVTISAPPALAAAFLPAALVELHELHPGLSIRLIGEARNASLARGDADVAIRLGRPEEGDLTVVKLGSMAFRLYATPDYLAAHDEADWQFIGYEGPMNRSPQQQRLEAYAAGRPFAMLASSVELQLAIAAAGGGVVALPDFMDRGSRLVVAAPSESLISREVWLVVHSDLKKAAHVRVVVQKLRSVWKLLK